MRRWKAVNRTSLAVVAIILGLALGMIGSRVVQAQGGGPNTGGPTAQAPGELALKGTSYWAVVRADGTIARHRGAIATGTGPAGTGAYRVNFADNIRNCAYTATIGDFDAEGIAPTGEITTVGSVADVRGVFLTTHDSAGNFANRPFHLLVSC